MGDSRLRGNDVDWPGNDGDTVVREIPAYAGMTKTCIGMTGGLGARN